MVKYNLSAHLDPRNTGVLVVNLSGGGSRDVSWVGIVSVRVEVVLTVYSLTPSCPPHSRTAWMGRPGGQRVRRWTVHRYVVLWS